MKGESLFFSLFTKYREKYRGLAERGEDGEGASFYYPNDWNYFLTSGILPL